MSNRELAEHLYAGMADLKTNCPNGTMLSSAVLCDFAGKMHFIKWIENQLDEYDGGCQEIFPGTREALDDLSVSEEQNQ